MFGRTNLREQLFVQCSAEPTCANNCLCNVRQNLLVRTAVCAMFGRTYLCEQLFVQCSAEPTCANSFLCNVRQNPLVRTAVWAMFERTCLCEQLFVQCSAEPTCANSCLCDVRQNLLVRTAVCAMFGRTYLREQLFVQYSAEPNCVNSCLCNVRQNLSEQLPGWRKQTKPRTGNEQHLSATSTRLEPVSRQQLQVSIPGNIIMWITAYISLLWNQHLFYFCILGFSGAHTKAQNIRVQHPAVWD